MDMEFNRFLLQTGRDGVAQLQKQAGTRLDAVVAPGKVGQVVREAADGLGAAVDAQARLGAELWPDGAGIRVRMGLHTGEVEERGGDYFGPAVNRAARLMAVAHGGQVVCSEVTAGLVPVDIVTVDLGEHRLRDLDQPVHVFQVGEGRFPPLRSLGAFPGNLPLQLSSLIGRERELGRVAAALTESRVVTLTGVGGVGKTRLALQVAADLVPRFREGAWLVELAPVRDPAAVVEAVAGVFGVSVRAGLSLEASLVDFLRIKQLLVVIDNCEHLLEPVADLLDALVHACPKLVVLATSQEGLGLDGERILVVASLGAPPDGADLEAVGTADAVRLFVDRAGQVDAEFALTPANATSVVEVCRRLDGVPLAIELAAARVGAMTPAELAAGLDRRFDMFARGRRKAVKRHQTLRAAMDWSYELCAAPEQRLLARLAVFAGGFTRDAAESVCGWSPLDAPEVSGLLTSLVAKSLVVADRADTRTRYRLLETIREYGDERLDEYGETTDLGTRHARYFAEALERRDCRGIVARPDAASWIAAEQANLERAMSHALDTADVELAFRLLCGMPWANTQSGSFSLPADPVLAVAGAHDHPEYPLGLLWAATQAALRGDLEVATQLRDEAIAAEFRLGTHPDGFVDQHAAGVDQLIAMAVGAWRDAANATTRGAAIAIAAARFPDAAAFLNGAASYYAYAGDTDAAVQSAVEGLALARQVGYTNLVTMGLGALANALADRDPARAHALLVESLDLAAATDSESANLLTQAVLVAARLDEPRLALELGARSVPRLIWNGDRPQLAGVLTVIAWAAADAEPETAAILQSAARALIVTGLSTHRPPISDSPTAPDTAAEGPAGIISKLRRNTSRLIRARLGEERLLQLRSEGELLDVDQAVALALTLTATIPASQ